MRVCVIGAGVVGVTSAYFLARQGHDVVLVDSQPRPAEVSSYANGGQLSYSVAPLAGPGVLPSVPGWLLRSDSPLRFRPRLDPHQWRWCLQFALACRASVARASTAELLTLSYLSRDAMHALLAQENLDFGHLKNGKLIAYRSAELLDKARALVAYQAAHGADQQVLDAAQTLALEPALAGMGASLAGAIYTPSEEAGDCRQFTEALFDRLQGMANAMRDVQSGLGPVAGRPPRRGGAEPRRRHRRGRGGAGDRHRHARALAAGPRRAALSAQGLQPDRAAGRRRPHGARHQRH